MVISIVSIYELTYGMNSFKDESLKSVFEIALQIYILVGRVALIPTKHC